MLRKRSGAVGSTQGLMPDYPSLPSPTAKSNRPSPSSLLPSPRLFIGSFTGKGSADSEAVMSPTSILEAKHFSAFGISLFDRNSKKPPMDATAHPPSENSRHHHWENGEERSIGLGLVDALIDEDNQKSPKMESRKVLFGSQLKIQIPSIFPTSMSRTSSLESANSPIEFGIKTKNSLLGSLSPGRRSPMGSGNLGQGSPRVFPGSLSLSEMELSEDYTCVITHGPNPRTTHIFDNYIVESCGEGFSISTKENVFLPDQPGYPSAGFLSFCHACKKDLGQGNDTFMYRGEKAFCSRQCRYQEFVLDEGMVKCSSEPTDDI